MAEEATHANRNVDHRGVNAMILAGVTSHRRNIRAVPTVSRLRTSVFQPLSSCGACNAAWAKSSFQALSVYQTNIAPVIQTPTMDVATMPGLKKNASLSTKPLKPQLPHPHPHLLLRQTIGQRSTSMCTRLQPLW